MKFHNNKLNKFIGSYIVLNVGLVYTNIKFLEKEKNLNKYSQLLFI